MDLSAMIGQGSALIAGNWLDGAGEPFEIVDPATETTLATVPACTPEQVDRAVAAARAAFEDGPWPHLSPAERGRLLSRMADAVEQHFDALVETIVREVGTPISLARAIQVGGPIENLRWYAEAALRGPQGGYEQGLPLHHNPVTTTGLLVREPIGVVAAMTAFNYPINLLTWKLGALAAGCTVVVLPSPRGVLSTVHFLRAIEDADLPPGVINLIVGGPQVGERLTTAPDVDMVSFTGSARVGSLVMAQAAATMKRVVLELGGKSPNILLPSADIDAALPSSILRFCRNAGQGCGATTRILVHRDRYDELIEKATRFLDTVTVGDPMDPATVVGPLIADAQRQWVEQMLERAVADGARVAAGGGRPDLRRGYYLNPAIVVDAPNEADVCQEELFAPVGAVLAYETVDEAVALANRSRYGLNANVFGDTAEAVAVAKRLRTGTVQVNGGGGLRPDAPWGGYGHSGVGREMGEDGFREFFEVKHVQWPLGAPAPPQGMAPGKS